LAILFQGANIYKVFELGLNFIQVAKVYFYLVVFCQYDFGIVESMSLCRKPAHPLEDDFTFIMNFIAENYGSVAKPCV